MALSAHTIAPGLRTRKRHKRLGRGNGSGKGTYSTRGIKGQRARSGGKGGLQRKGFKASLQKVPKLRGFRSARVRSQLVSLAQLEKVCENTEKVTPEILHRKGLIHDPRGEVKIVATGALTKKLMISGCVASKQALVAIEKVGGKLQF